MKEVIKKHKGKITIGSLTGAGALIVILLTIYEKTEAIISRATPSSDKIAYEHNYKMDNNFSQSIPKERIASPK